MVSKVTFEADADQLQKSLSKVIRVSFKSGL